MRSPAYLARLQGSQAALESPGLLALKRDNGSVVRAETVLTIAAGAAAETPITGGTCLYLRGDGFYGIADPMDPLKMPATVIVESILEAGVFACRPLALLAEMAFPLGDLIVSAWYCVGTDGRVASSASTNFPQTGQQQVVGQAVSSSLLRIEPGRADAVSALTSWTFWLPWTDTPVSVQTPPDPGEPTAPLLVPASAANEEFNDTASLLGWHQMGTWTPGGLDRGGASYTSPADGVRYSYVERPSWLIIQPALGSTLPQGLERSYGSSPTNWRLTANISIDINSALGGDSIFFLLMGATDPSPTDPGPGVNPMWPFDNHNFVSLFSATNDSKVGFSFFSVIGGVESAAETILLDTQAHLYNLFRIHKVGGTFRASLGTVGGNWRIFNAPIVPGITVNRYGFLVQSTSAKNVTFGVDWLRHAEIATFAD